MIGRFFDKDVDVARLTTVTGNKIAYTTVATIKMAIQELNKFSRPELNLQKGRIWIGYTGIENDDNILDDDRLIDGHGTVYKIIERTRKDYGTNQHVEILFVKYED